MKYQIVTSKSDPHQKSYIWYTSGIGSWGILFDPHDNWSQVKDFLGKEKIQLKYIFLTHANFDTSARISQIQQETSAHFLSFQNDLLKLRMLPKWADEKNVCGIKIPHVNRFLDGCQTLDLSGFELTIESHGDVHQYSLGKLRVPEK